MNGTRVSSLLGKITVLVVICCCSLSAQGKYGGGSGTPDDPYQIRDANHMQAIGADSNDWDKHFKLMADIDLSAFTGTAFNIIGNSVAHFTGVFDGNGHIISNFTHTSTHRNYVGLFALVSGVNAEIKNLGLIDPNIDAGTGYSVGSMVGLLGDATITNCYVEGGSVAGRSNVGGLVEINWGTITNSYSEICVSGTREVGGLVGILNDWGTIINCYSTGSVSGDLYIGGLVAYNAYYSTITNCYSTASVWGDRFVGGLLGLNHKWCIGGTPPTCYYGTIINCYSTASVSGYYSVGGLVGKKYGEVSASFWDIETSGQTTSAGGTGLPTDQMQMVSTFIDAGWDFMGETLNGTEDIWFIPQQDYPHLWWQGMQVPMKLTPGTLNCRSYGNWVKAHLTLPQGFTVEDVDPERSAVLRDFHFESAHLYVSVNKDKLVQIEAAFERQVLCSLAGDWPQMLTVNGFLADGNTFLGSSTVRIIHPGMKVIEELASYWLQADCLHPTWCDRIDMNRDSLVNLADYALLMNSNIEFVSE